MATDCCCPQKNLQNGFATLWQIDPNNGAPTWFSGLFGVAGSADVRTAVTGAKISHWQWGVTSGAYKVYHRRSVLASGNNADDIAVIDMSGTIVASSGAGSRLNAAYASNDYFWLYGGSTNKNAWGFAGLDDDHVQFVDSNNSTAATVLEYDETGANTASSSTRSAFFFPTSDETGYVFAISNGLEFIPKNNLSTPTTIVSAINQGGVPIGDDGTNAICHRQISGVRQLRAYALSSGATAWDVAVPQMLDTAGFNTWLGAVSQSAGAVAVVSTTASNLVSVYATSSGSAMWSDSHGLTSGIVIPRVVAVGGRFVLYRPGGPVMSLYDASSGVKLWTVDYTNLLGATRAIRHVATDGNRIFIGTDSSDVTNLILG